MRMPDAEVLLFIAAVLVVILVVQYFRLKGRLQSDLNELRFRSQSDLNDLRSRSESELNDIKLQVNERVQQEFDLWKTRQLEAERARLWQAAQEGARLDLERWRTENEEDIRADARNRSSAVVLGKVTEHLTPYLGTFPYNAKDVRFLGTPIDLIVFDGMDEGTLRNIVCLEIKTASSTLTTRERRIRDAVLEKRIVWDEFRVRGA
jgi:predicted Holliday junction resolvase-like endonuclease